MIFLSGKKDERNVVFLLDKQIDLLTNLKYDFTDFGLLKQQVLNLSLQDIASIVEINSFINYHINKDSNKVSNFIQSHFKTNQDTLLLDHFISEINNKLISNYQSFKERLNTFNTFYVKSNVNTIYIGMSDTQSDTIPAGWNRLISDQFNNALMETLYKDFGYFSIHFQPLRKSNVDQFTFSDVLALATA